MISIFLKNGGFTFIELVIIIAIVGIVLIAVSNLFIDNYKMYNIAQSQSHLQSEVRQSVSFISKKVKNAREVELFSSINEVNISGSPDGYHYLYLDDTTIKYLDNTSGTNVIKNLTGENININSFDLKLNKLSNGNNFLFINVISTLDKRSYIFDTSILLNNIKNQDIDTNTNEVLKFKK